MRILTSAAWFFGLFYIYPIILGIMAVGTVVGLSIMAVDHIPGAHSVFVATGLFDDENLISAQPLRVQWDSAGTGKTITVRITNKSGEAWDRFSIKCPTDRSPVTVTDMSGLLPGEYDVRTYALERSSTVNETIGMCKLTMHQVGKPKTYDVYAAHDYGDGGWGDRLPLKETPMLMNQ